MLPLPFHIPAAYWLYLRHYDPVSAAAALDKPILILQGGRDYQATVAEGLEGLRSGVQHRDDAVIRIYPDDNHFFFMGTGPSSPAEYEPAQHVDEAVVADVTRFIAGDSANTGTSGMPQS